MSINVTVSGFSCDRELAEKINRLLVERRNRVREALPDGREWVFGAVIGDGVRTLRIEAGLTQDEFARRLSAAGLGWDQPAISRLEMGCRGVSVEQLHLLAATLNVPLWRLFGGEDGDWVRMSPRLRWRVAALRDCFRGYAPPQGFPT